MIKKNWPFVFTLIVFVVDWLLFNTAFVLAAYWRFQNLAVLKNYIPIIIAANILFFPLAIGLGVYRGLFQSSLANQKQPLKKFTIFLSLVFMSYLFLVKGSHYSRGLILIFLVSQYALLDIGRSILFRINKYLIKKGFGSKKTIIVGTDTSTLVFYEHLKHLFGDYYKVKGFVNNGHPERELSELKPYIIGNQREFDQVVLREKPEQVFIVSDSMSLSKYEKIIQISEKYNFKLKMVSPFVKDLMHQVKVRDVTGVPLTTNNKRRRYLKFRKVAKRIFDLTVVSLLAIPLLPIGTVIAISIKLTSKGPVFFKQERALYKNGPTFKFLKFRTMYENADEIKEKLLEKNESNGALFKMKKDPRVTPIGRFLRKYSLDEIPQFINVLKGEMSLVGPRPLPIKDFDLIKNGKMNYDWYKKRGEAKPGITGLWQISGRSDLTFEEMCMLDLYYIENHSIFFDMEIIFDTIPVILTGKGAY